MPDLAGTLTRPQGERAGTVRIRDADGSKPDPGQPSAQPSAPLALHLCPLSWAFVGQRTVRTVRTVFPLHLAGQGPWRHRAGRQDPVERQENVSGCATSVSVGMPTSCQCILSVVAAVWTAETPRRGAAWIAAHTAAAAGSPVPKPTRSSPPSSGTRSPRRSPRCYHQRGLLESRRVMKLATQCRRRLRRPSWSPPRSHGFPGVILSRLAEG